MSTETCPHDLPVAYCGLCNPPAATTGPPSIRPSDTEIVVIDPDGDPGFHESDCWHVDRADAVSLRVTMSLREARERFPGWDGQLTCPHGGSL